MNRVEQIDDRVIIRSVLISVSDKSELETLTPALLEIPGLVIYSTGGTYARLAEIIHAEAGDGRSNSSARLQKVSDYTGQPEMQGGLVKTLDYKIYLGLLSEPGNRDHETDRARVGANLIDMVVVNLYPFRSVASRTGSDLEDARGNIDIGGPCMLRAAAKNYLRVAAVCDPSDYGSVAGELRESGGSLGIETRFRMAQKAFGHTAQYDRAIADYLSRTEATALRTVYSVQSGPDQG